jgi:hypothetical protein
MKKSGLLLVIIFTSLFAYPQFITVRSLWAGSLRGDTLVLKESVDKYSILVKSNMPTNVDAEYRTEIISADPGDFIITGSNPILLRADNEYQASLDLKVTEDSKPETAEQFRLIIRYLLNGTTSYDTTIIEIADHSKPVKTRPGNVGAASVDTEADDDEDGSDKKEQKGSMMYLNAFNFDFGNTGSQSNYVGHLNVYRPDLQSRWGVNAGIMKVNYTQDDSTINERHVIENVLINPYEELKDNSKYLKQINSYKTKRTNTVWSLYVQPLYRLTNPDIKSAVYAHGHLELLPTKWSSKTTITNIRQDTATYLPSPSFVARTILSTTSSYTINGVYGYFGFGFTFDLQLWEKAKFFIQPTIGTTSNFPQPASIDINSSTFPDHKNPERDKWSSFYLVRAYFTQEINDNSKIVIGTDIRGMFPLYAPLYAAYVGLNLSLDKVLELIKGK